VSVGTRMRQLLKTAPYKFQVQGARFLERLNGKAIIGLLLPTPIITMGLRNKGDQMPSGVYKRSPEHIAKIRKYLSLGHSPEARAKANEAMRHIGKDPEWRQRVGASTRLAMRRPDVRRRHLKALERNLKRDGVHFKGGNGQDPSDIVKWFQSILEPLGFVRECAVKTKGHSTGLSAPDCYKLDFGDPKTKVAMELDGSCHHTLTSKMKDEKKELVLEALGWKIVRVRHG